MGRGRVEIGAEQFVARRGKRKQAVGQRRYGTATHRAGESDGRGFAGQVFGVAVPGEPDQDIIVGSRGAYTLPDQFNLDLALEKEFKIKNVRFALFLQAFNVFNFGVADMVETSTSNSARPFGQMTSITDPFYLRIGARFDFN